MNRKTVTATIGVAVLLVVCFIILNGIGWSTRYRRMTEDIGPDDPTDSGINKLKYKISRLYHSYWLGPSGTIWTSGNDYKYHVQNVIKENISKHIKEETPPEKSYFEKWQEDWNSANSSLSGF